MLLVLYSQALQSVVLLVVVVAVSQPYSAAALGWGTAAGAVGAAGLVAYYQALATGQTAIVAPLASSGAVVPLLVDLTRGERPSPLALAGLVLVLVGIAVTSLASAEWQEEEAPAPTWHGPPATRRRVAVPRPPPPVLLALVAAICFGLFFIGVDLGGEAAGGGVLWVALGVQVGALPTTLAGAVGVRGRRLGFDDPALLWPVGVLTVLNLSGDAFLAYAVTRGDLAVVAVLGSLAPVVTAVAARLLTAERPAAAQTAGAAMAVIGTLVVSAAQAAA